LPLLYAGVEHRAWVAAVENVLLGEGEAPQLDHRLCRLGTWLINEGMAVYGAQASFLDIEQSHQQVHVLASDLLEHQAQGRNHEALARLYELHGLRDNLLAKLKCVLLTP
jgi:hypothetical protein